MEDFDVGAKLRALRIAKGLSQRQLAEAARVPHGQISMIETNRSSPSIASLRKILSGLNIGMAEFFEPETPGPGQVFFRPADRHDLTSRIAGRSGGRAGGGGPGHGAGGGRVIIAQLGDAPAHNLQILHETYEPGADTGRTMLAHAGSEGGIVIAGEIEVTVGAQVQILREGDGYLFDSAAPHRFRNLTDRLAVVVSACTPPWL